MAIDAIKENPDILDTLLQTINQKYQSFHATKDEKGPLFAKRKIPTAHFQGHNVWLLKATGFNRGRGIHVFNRLEDLRKLIKEYTEGLNFENLFVSQQQTAKLISKQLPAGKDSQPQANEVPSYLKSTSFVIQKYVEAPLLINKRKFDIRVWVLVA